MESAHVLAADTFGLDTAHSPFHLSRVMRKAKLTAPPALTTLLIAAAALTGILGRHDHLSIQSLTPMKSILTLVQACVVTSATIMAAETATQTSSTLPPPVTEQRVVELKQLRFGMFVCWSFSTFSGKEWTPGITNLDLFHPTGCDVEQWVKTAKAAEMGYILFFTYPIVPPHQGGAMWFYSLPRHDQSCLPAEKIYADYLGAAKFGNLFSLDVGPDYAGKLRKIDVQTLRKVGQYIRGELKPIALCSTIPATILRCRWLKRSD